MRGHRNKLACCLLLTSLGLGCGSGASNPTGDLAQENTPATSPSSGNQAEHSSEPAQAAAPITESQAAVLPELVIPSRPTTDAEVTPAAAVGVPVPLHSVPAGKAPQSVFARLVEAYRTGQPEQWAEAEAALNALGAEAFPMLMDGLKSADRQTRELASMMLAQILPNLWYVGDVDQRPDLAPLTAGLRKALQDPSEEVRVNVAVALSLLEGEAPKLVPVFLELLTSDRPHVRTMAVVALGNLGPAASPALGSLRNLSQSDPDPAVKAAATEALALLQTAIPQ